MESLFPDNPLYIHNQNAEVREQYRRLDENSPEAIARESFVFPRLSDEQARGFRLHYGEVHDRPGTRYNLLGQKIYDPPPLVMDGRLGIYEDAETRGTLSTDPVIQTRGIRVIDALNQGDFFGRPERSFTVGVESVFARQLRPALSVVEQVQAAGMMGLTRDAVSDLVGPFAVRSGVYGPSVGESTLDEIVSDMRVKMPSEMGAVDNNQMGAYAERYADSEQVKRLVGEIRKLRGQIGGGLQRIEEKYAYRNVSGRLQKVLVGVRVAVRNYNDLFDGLGLYSQGSYAGVERQHYFNFTVNARGQVIETGTNRVISGSLMSLGAGGGAVGGAQSSFQTVVGLLGTYARSSELEARHGVVDELFNTMVSQGDYSPLGRVFAETLAGRNEKYVVNQGLRLGESLGRVLQSVGFNDFHQTLKEVIEDISYKGLDYYATIGEVFNEESAAWQKLYDRRRNTLMTAFEPVFQFSGGLNRFNSVVDETLRRVSTLVQSEASQLSVQVDGRQINVSLFDDLKLASLSLSPVGRSAYDLRKNQTSQSILQLLMSPFLMPHETGYSGAQGSARLGFYNLADTKGGRAPHEILMLSPAIYRHGLKGTAPGEYYKPIGAQSVQKSLFKYLSGTHRFDEMAQKVASFYSTKELFAGMPSLKRVKLRDIETQLARTNYQTAKEILKRYRNEMRLEEDEDTEVLLMPFRKPEQISQRLKNLVGGRPMLEIKTGLRRAMLAQNGHELRKYFKRGDYGLQFDTEGLAGNIPAMLSDIQYQRLKDERARILGELGYRPEDSVPPGINRQVSQLLTQAMREAEMDLDMRGGYIGGRAARRMVVGMGVNTLSDFMLVNQQYLDKSAFAYQHLSTLRLPATHGVHYDGVGRVVESDPLFHQRLNRVREVFQAGTRVFMQPQVLKEPAALDVLKKVAKQLRSDFAARGIDKKSTDSLVQRTLMSTFRFLDSVDVAGGEVTNAMMRPGAYRFDDNGFKFEGELVDSSIRLGLGLRGGSRRRGDLGYGDSTSLDFFDVKVPGIIRSGTGGVATVASDAVFKQGQGSGYEADIHWLISTETTTGTRSSSLTKGPWTLMNGSAFDRWREQALGRSLLSRQTQQDDIFALMSPTLFKGYNYESGLDILRDAESRRKLLAIPADELTFLLGMAFMEKETKGARLRQAMKEYVQTRSMGSAVGLVLEDNRFGVDGKKLRNLLLSAPDLLELTGGQHFEKFNDYLAERLERRDFDPIQLGVSRIIERAMKASVQMEQSGTESSSLVRTFREGNFSVRSAGLLADVLNVTRQLVDPYLDAGNRPITGFNFVEEGRARVDRFINEKAFRSAALDIAEKMGVRGLLPSQFVLESKLAGAQPDSELYQRVEEVLQLLQAHLRTTLLVERAANILPSRTLVPTGSEDAVGLEYHYSLNLSQKELAGLRGTGLDTEGFTALQAAYSTVSSHGSMNRISRMMQVISPFGVDKNQVGISRVMSRLVEGFNEVSGRFKFMGATGNLSLLDETVRSLISGNNQRTIQLMARYDLVNRALRHQKGLGPFTEKTVMNIVGALNPSRLELEKASDAQLAALGELYGVSGERIDLIKGLQDVGPVLGRSLLYFGSSANPFNTQRQAMAKAIVGYADLKYRRREGQSLLYGVSADDGDVKMAMRRGRLSQFGLGYSDFRQALELVTDGVTGRLLDDMRGDEVTNIGRIAGRLQDNDRVFERLVESAAGVSSTESFVDVLYRVASGAQQVIQNTEVGSAEYKRAERLRTEVYQTRSLLMPYVDVLGRGSKNVMMLYDPSEISGRVRYQSAPVVQLGLDVLSQLPIQFENHISEVIERQRRIWEIVPEFQGIMDRLSRGPIYNANPGELEVVQEMQRLAIQSQDDAALIFSSVMQQRSEGEKVKYPGASFTAVADYLVGRDEVFVGERVYGGSLGQIVNDVGEVHEKTRRLKDRLNRDRERLLRGATTRSAAISQTRAEYQQSRELHQELSRKRLEIQQRFNEQTWPLKEKRKLLSYYEKTLHERNVKENYTAESLRQVRARQAQISAELDVAYGLKHRELSEIDQQIRENRLKTKQLQQRLPENRLMQFTVGGQQVAVFPEKFLRKIGTQEGLVNRELQQLIVQASDDLMGSITEGKEVFEADRAIYDRIVQTLQQTNRLGQNTYQLELSRIESAMAQAMTGPMRGAVQRPIHQYFNQKEAFRRWRELDDKSFGFSQRESSILDRVGQLTGYLHRAGGPSAASINVNQKHDVKPVEVLRERALAEGNQLALSIDGNKTALIASMYGRFGVQGGDFDGDSYQLVFGFRDLQESLVRSVQRRNDLQTQLMKLESELGKGGYGLDLEERRAEVSRHLGLEQDTVNQLLSEIEGRFESVGQQISEGVRRHVAAFTGLPSATLLDKSLYSDEEVYNMIEQQRGVTPGLTDIGDEYGAELSSFTQLFREINPELGGLRGGQLTQYLDSRLRSGSYGLSKDQLSLFRALVEKSVLNETIVSASDRQASFFEELAGLSNLRAGLGNQHKFIQSAAGSPLDLQSFEVLQSSIGYVGTSLIGEGYNAITTMMGRGLLSRVMGAKLKEGIDRDSLGLASQIHDRLDMLFAGGEKASLASSIKEKFSGFELKRTAAFAEDRAQMLTQNLGLIQQIIRDSLKPKEAGGLIKMISDNSIGDKSFREKFLEDGLEDTQRLELMRDFVSTRAVTSMVSSDRQKLINTFGAIFLMADYTKSGDVSRLLTGDGDRYAVLRSTRQTYEEGLRKVSRRESLEDFDVLTRLRLQDKDFARKMVNDDEFLVRQTITDLVNSAVAQEVASKYIGYRDEKIIPQANILRQQYMQAIAFERGIGDDVGIYFKSPEHRAAMMDVLHIGDKDVLNFAERGEIQNVFDIKSGFEAIYQHSRLRSSYLGMQAEDIEFSRSVIQAGRSIEFMDFGTEVAFTPFMSAQAENTVALQQWMKRGKLNDPRALRDVQIGSAARMFDAIAQVNRNLEERYGSLDQALSRTDIYQAYTQVAELAGNFDLGREETEMLSLAMAAKPNGRQSIFEQLADLSAGRALVQEKQNQIESIYQQLDDSDGSQRLHLEQRLELLESSLDKYYEGLRANQVEKGRLQAVLSDLGQRERLLRMNEARGRERQLNTLVERRLGVTPEASGASSLGVMNTLGLFAAPIVGAALMEGGLDERLISGGYDALQGLATVEGITGNEFAGRANRLFTLSRFKEQMIQNESLLLGAGQAVLAESLYMGIAGIASRTAQNLTPGRRQSGVGSLFAEVAVTAAALAFSRRGHRYGIDQEPYRNLMAEALTETARATEEFTAELFERAADIQVETEDQIVTFDFDPSLAPSEYEERLTTGWIDLTVSTEDMGPDSFQEVYYESGSYV